MQPYIARQRARFPRGPQLLDVAGVGVFTITECRTELLLAAVAPALNGHGLLPAPRSPVPAQHYHLVAGKEIGQAAGLHVVQLNTRTRGNRHVGEYGARHFGGQRPHRAFDVLAGTDVLGRASGPLGQPVEEKRIYVVTDAERKHAELPAPLFGACGDLFRIRLARARLAVGQEDNDAQRLFSRRLCERLRQRAGDIGAALGVETPNPALRVATGIARDAGPSFRVAAHAARERDQSESVTLAQ